MDLLFDINRKRRDEHLMIVLKNFVQERYT